MANLCEKLISSCISADCDNPIYTGMEQTAYIFNFKDIVDHLPDTTDENFNGNPNLVTEFIMREISAGVTATGYRILNLGKTPFTGTNTAFAAGNVSNKFNETVVLVVPDASATAAEQVDKLANGKFIIVLQNSYPGSDNTGRFQIYGLKRGLTASDISRDPYSADTDGAYMVTLTSENVPNSGMFLQHTDIDNSDDTLAYLESITSCV